MRGNEIVHRRRHGRCDVALLVDVETGARSRDGRFVPHRGSAEAYVLDVLRESYRDVAVVPFDSGVVATIETLRRLKPRIVFNMTEWVGGDRALDAAVAGLLDLMGLRYTGAGPDGMRLARDKALAKTIVSELGVEVPRHFVVNGTGPIRNPGLPYPLIVKPRSGDGSDEISRNSVVNGLHELNARIERLRARFGGALLCEEYVEGRDLFVALLGNGPEVLAPLELRVGVQRSASPRIATRHVKHNPRYRSRWRIHYREASLPAGVAAAVHEASRAIFHALKLRDYARIDYRLTSDNRLVFLEANPNPDLAPHTFGRNRCFAGVPYPDLIRRIVESARRRRD